MNWPEWLVPDAFAVEEMLRNARIVRKAFHDNSARAGEEDLPEDEEFLDNHRP
jgi:hypothetical protein